MEWSVARHHAMAGKLIAELHIQTIRINSAARLSVILAGYVIGSVIAQYLGKDYVNWNKYLLNNYHFTTMAKNYLTKEC